MKRNTIQRTLVLEAVNHLRSHATAEEVYDAIVQQHPHISKGTVYRNLNQLSENHLIRRVVVPGDSDHFDHTLKEHEHMICTQCGCVVDIWQQVSLQSLFYGMEGAHITGYDLTLYGVCDGCARKRGEAQQQDTEHV